MTLKVLIRRINRLTFATFQFPLFVLFSSFVTLTMLMLHQKSLILQANMACHILLKRTSILIVYNNKFTAKQREAFNLSKVVQNKRRQHSRKSCQSAFIQQRLCNNQCLKHAGCCLKSSTDAPLKQRSMQGFAYYVIIQHTHTRMASPNNCFPLVKTKQKHI